MKHLVTARLWGHKQHFDSKSLINVKQFLSIPKRMVAILTCTILPFGIRQVVSPLFFLFLLSPFCQIFAQTPCAFTVANVGGATDHFQFTSTFSGDCIDFETWDLGDGTSLIDVHNPEHLYLPTGVPIPKDFTVTHTVQFQGQTFTCQQVVHVVFTNPVEPCFNNYFRYRVDGCLLTLLTTLDNVGAVIDLTIDFGDGSTPVTNPGSSADHSYAMPGTYTVTQTYVAMDPGSGITYTGSCSRPVTVGCCCDPELEVEFHMDDCEGPFAIIRTGVGCCVESVCNPTLTVIVGDNPPVTLDACNDENRICITNYSTYASAPNNLIRVIYNSFCHGQPVSETLSTQPPIPGIFLGLDPLNPTNCDPTNVFGSPFGSNAGGLPGAECNRFFSLLTDYSTVLPGNVLNPNNGLTRDVYVAPNSIIQVNKSYSFWGAVRIFMGANSGWDVLHKPTAPPGAGGHKLEITSGVQLGLGGCCMWRGVDVYGNGQFATTGTPASGNLITNALYAVRAFSRFSSRPRLTLRNTTFDDNFVSLRATDGDFRLVAFQDNTLTSSGLLCMTNCMQASIDVLPPGVSVSAARSFAGMFIQGGGDPAFGILNLTDLAIPSVGDDQVNLFEHLNNGVIARNLNLSIEDCMAFDDIQVAGYPVATNGIGVNWLDESGNWMLTYRGLTDALNPVLINGMAFNDCRIGLRAESQAPGNPSDISIRSCQMNDVLLGVDLRTPNGDLAGFVSNNDIHDSANGIAFNDQTATPSSIGIANNVINVTNTGITVAGPDLSGGQQVEIGPNNQIEAAGPGILSVNYNRAYIHNNTINGFNTGTGIQAMDGETEIECNTIQDALVGISVTNNSIFADLSFNDITDCATGLQVWGDCPALGLIQCNTFINSDLRYINGAETGDQFNTGNVWINSSAFADASVVVANSEYTVPTGTGPGAAVPANWFLEDPLLTLPNCTEVCQSGFAGGGGEYRNGSDASVSKHNISSATGAKVFPVPVNEMLNLELTSGATLREYEIISALGTTLGRSATLEGRNVQIDTSEFPEGMCFIRILTSTGEQITMSFVIQR